MKVEVFPTADATGVVITTLALEGGVLTSTIIGVVDMPADAIPGLLECTNRLNAELADVVTSVNDDNHTTTVEIFDMPVDAIPTFLEFTRRLNAAENCKKS